DRMPMVKEDRIVTTPGYYEYLKIAEGCDKRCTYCIIPKVRGSYRSFPVEYLVGQAEKLVAGGVRELILVAQETTLYGVDLYGKKS
ncbi:radical SAM protein, partial [Acinetobacter baumannii]|uniref:radical SAM protein n=1 Tax=Acinetobacter baumannii TaxID=470 RepID=UPI003324E339